MVPAPFYSDMADGPVGGSAYWLDTDDGTRIRISVWPKGHRGTVLIFPGRTEYCEKYGRAAADFAKLGFACVAVDWRGQGIADRQLANRKIGHVEQFSDFQIDVAAVRKAISVFRLPTPVFLVAHSMGGCIGLRALYNGLDVKKAMFSAPMWGITFKPTFMKPVAWGLSTVMHPTPARHMLSPGTDAEAYLIEGTFADNTLTTDRAMYDYMASHLAQVPDLAVAGPSVQWLYSALREMRDLARKPSPPVECVTFLGTAEDIVSPQAIKDRMAKWSGGTLEVVENARHEIMMETPATRARFYAAADAFFT